MRKIAVRRKYTENGRICNENCGTALRQDGLTFSRRMVYRQVFAQIVAVASMYIFLRRAIYGRFWWGCCFWLVPVVLDLPFMVLTTGRPSPAARPCASRPSPS